MNQLSDQINDTCYRLAARDDQLAGMTIVEVLATYDGDLEKLTQLLELRERIINRRAKESLI